MVDPTPFQRPIRWDALRADEAQRVINDWARTTANVVITAHALERNEERLSDMIDTAMIYETLRLGVVVDEPLRNERGHWQAKVERRMPGGREVVSVTVILKDEQKLIVRTIMWKDER